MRTMRRTALALAVLVSSGARADGAFPTGMSVLLPAGAPQRILVGTTFGLVLSEDAGATFRYVCEPYVTASGASVLVYQTGSDGGIVAAHQDALSRTSDLGCTWTRASGLPAGVVTDAFIDPSNPSSVLAIDLPPAGGASLLASADGGRSFGSVLLTSGTPPLNADERLLSVEIAASAPGVYYATTFAFPSPSHPAGTAALLRSGNGGASWTRFELGVGPSVQVKIAQVDPADPNTVYLLVISGVVDELRVTADGGATVQPLLAPGTSLGGFVRASDGALYAGTTGGSFYVRAPGAATFDQLSGPHLRCLGERAGRVYACGDSIADGYDLATTDDRGKSFRKLLTFVQLLGPATCPAVQSACAADFDQLQRTLIGAPGAGSCSCGHPSGNAGALLILLAAALRRRRRAPARDRR
jgi:MYXO-CTERM domain-containing protein